MQRSSGGCVKVGSLVAYPRHRYRVRGTVPCSRTSVGPTGAPGPGRGQLSGERRSGGGRGYRHVYVGMLTYRHGGPHLSNGPPDGKNWFDFAWPRAQPVPSVVMRVTLPRSRTHTVNQPSTSSTSQGSAGRRSMAARALPPPSHTLRRIPGYRALARRSVVRARTPLHLPALPTR
jgi:hypothetical protein